MSSYVYSHFGCVVQYWLRYVVFRSLQLSLIPRTAIETHHLPCPSLANRTLYRCIHHFRIGYINLSGRYYSLVARVVVLGVHHSCIWWRETRGRYVIYLVMFYVSVDV